MQLISYVCIATDSASVRISEQHSLFCIHFTTPTPFHFISPSFRNLLKLGDFNCHHSLWDSKGTFDFHGSCSWSFDWVMFFLSMTLTYLLFFIAPPRHSSLDISFAPGRGFRTWVLISYKFLSLAFRPNERPPSFNFQRARWDQFAFYFDSHCPSAEEYFSFLCCCSLPFSDTECDHIFHFFWSS